MVTPAPRRRAASSVAYQVGMNAAQATVSVTFGNFSDSDGSLSGLASKTLSAATIASAITVASGAGELDLAMTAVSSQRANFGATQNRLIHAVDNLTNVVVNAEVTRSRIMDTDYAEATSNSPERKLSSRPVPRCLRRQMSCPRRSCSCFSSNHRPG